MPVSKLFPLLALLVATTTAQAHAALGPSSPPPGVTSSAWNRMTGRAEWVAESVTKIAPKADKPCVYAVVLELLGLAQVEVSLDVKGRRADTPPLRRSVAKGQESSFSEALKRNVDDQCKGGSGGGLAESLRGVLKFAQDQGEWDTENYEALKRKVIHAAEAMIKLGIFVPAVERAVTLPAAPSVGLPVLNPSLFMSKEHDPRDGI